MIRAGMRGCVGIGLVLLLAGPVWAGWETEIIASDGSVGSDSRLALTPDGFGRVVYSGSSHWEFASEDALGWTLETVDTLGWSADIDVDSSGYAYVAYADYTTNSVYCAYQDSGGWNIDVIYSDPSAGMSAAIALDDADVPHLFYYRYDMQVILREAVKTGPTWSSVDAGTAGMFEEGYGYAVDHAGYGHVVYCATAGTHWLYHTWEDGSGWHTEPLNMQSLQASAAVDSSDVLHVVFNDETGGGVTHAWKDSTWQSEVVDALGDAYRPTIFVDDLDRIHLSYSRGMTSSLMHARKSGGSWDIQEAETAPNIAQTSSVAVGTSGQARISYSDGANGDLRYARQTPEVPAADPAGMLLLLLGLSALLFRRE